MSGRPYARVYYVDLERDYARVWRDSGQLGTFVRLLAIAEAMWPARPEFPHSIPYGRVLKLIEAGLILPATDGSETYRIKGMDAERDARSNAARIAARNRWGSANGNAETMPNRAEPSRTKPSRAEARGLLDAFREQGLPVDVKGAR